MTYKYLSVHKILNFYKNGDPIEDDLFIGSVADHLVVTEKIREIPLDTIKERNEQILTQQVFWGDLNSQNFAENAFNNDFDNLMFEGDIENYKVEPHYTCNLIILNSNDGSCYWDVDVKEQMNEIYGY